MRKLPFGLTYNENSEVVNDFRVLWFPEYDSRDVTTFDICKAVGRTPTGLYNTWWMNSLSVQESYTPKRSTIPYDPSGYRPVTTVRRIPTPFHLSIDCDLAWKSSSESGVLSLRNHRFGIRPDYDFDFHNQIGRRISTRLSAFSGQYGQIIAEGEKTLQFLLESLSMLREGVRFVTTGSRSRLRELVSKVAPDFFRRKHAVVPYDPYKQITWADVEFLIAQKMKKHPPKNHKPTGNEVANLWLMYRYGLMPLIYDTLSIIEDWDKLHKKAMSYFRFSAGGSDTVTVSGTTYPGSTGDFKLDYEVLLSRRQRTGFIFADRGGFGKFEAGEIHETKDLYETAKYILNPQATAWELIPYSFVADWFLNIGDILSQQMQLYKNVSVVDGYDRRDIRVAGVRITSGSIQGVPISSASIRGLRSAVHYERVHTATLPTISPQLDLDFSSMIHVADAIALLSQRFKR